MRTLTFCFAILFLALTAVAQPVERPKLVVGIVVDQMRWDYLYRYYDRYGKDGFRRLLEDGNSCENAFIPYTPTYTAPGHTCIYTGSVPALHGIVGNNWYDRMHRKVVYCTDDSTAHTVGSSSTAGNMSPANLWSNTIGDELRLATNFKSKVIAIALKDRASILPGGHAPTGAYWFDNASGGWITSTYYAKELPGWVKELNQRKLPDAYLQQNWNTLYAAGSYKQSSADDESFENVLPGGSNAFPHQTDNLSGNKYELFRSTPYGNTFTFDMARAAIAGESLGKGSETDFLALSFSSTDYIGHAFGPNSVEVEDTYLRLDRDLGAFLRYLDEAIGAGRYLVFLSADHGAAHVPAFARENRMPAGVMSDLSIMNQLNEQLKKDFSVPNLVEQVINYQVFLNYNAIDQNKLAIQSVKEHVIRTLLNNPGIANALDLSGVPAATLPEPLQSRITNGYNQKLSGDIQFVFKPQWFDGGEKGTTHSTWNPYDAHIPLIWYGWGVRPGSTNREVYMTDIAATLAAILKIQMPSACVGKVIEEVMEPKPHAGTLQGRTISPKR